MKIGVIFPTTEIGNDPAVIKDFAQTVEALGYNHLIAYDHVIGAIKDRPERETFPYSDQTPFHEPFVLFGYLAGLTSRLELVTSVIILPQRQTVLVAKQAAALDVLSGGRLRLGVGTGWNPVEYEALGKNFHDRGARLAEQVEVMRKLWAEPLVSFQGKDHVIDRAGLNPLPVRRSIPVWIGGGAETAIRRAARIGDGWFPLTRPDDKLKATVEQMRGWLQEAGRDPKDFGIEGRINLAGEPERWRAHQQTWEEIGGVTHLTVNTHQTGLGAIKDHLALIERYAVEFGVKA